MLNTIMQATYSCHRLPMNPRYSSRPVVFSMSWWFTYASRCRRIVSRRKSVFDTCDKLIASGLLLTRTVCRRKDRGWMVGIAMRDWWLMIDIESSISILGHRLFSVRIGMRGNNLEHLRRTNVEINRSITVRCCDHSLHKFRRSQ